MLLSLALVLPLLGLAHAIPSDPYSCPTVMPGYNVTAYAGPVDLKYCQQPKELGSQLDGCPNGTLYVSQTDPQAPYGQISEAVRAMPIDNSSVFILVGPGVYHDVVNITSPRHGPVTLLGITYDPSSHEANQVLVWAAAYICQKNQRTDQHNSDAAVLTVDFPSDHTAAPGVFAVHNIDFANRAIGPDGKEYRGQTGPAAAVFFTWTNATSYSSSYKSYQDTWYAGRNSSVYSFNDLIVGGTDFIYGYGTVWFEGATLASRETGEGSGLVAWKGTDGYQYGVYIVRSKVVQADDALPELDLVGTRALGRPWNNESRVIYQDTFMDEIVLPAGFVAWNPPNDTRVVLNLTVAIETGSYGPGFDLAARLNNSAIQQTFTAEEEDSGEVGGQKTHWELEDVFGEAKPSWIDWDYAQAE